MSEIADRVQACLCRLRDGAGPELCGLNVEAGAVALAYARERLVEWLLDVSEVEAGSEADE